VRMPAGKMIEKGATGRANLSSWRSCRLRRSVESTSCGEAIALKCRFWGRGMEPVHAAGQHIY